MTENEIALVAVGVCDDATEDFVRVRVDNTSRARIFLGFLGVEFILMTIGEDGELQQIAVSFPVSIFAMGGLPVAIGDAEFNQRSFKTVLEVAIAVISIGKPVWIAASRLPI